MQIQFKYIVAIALSLFISMSALQAAEPISYLLTAASKGDVAAVNALLKSGASANVKDEEGITP